MEKFYLTTSIFYVNAPPHLGHALEAIQADAIARYQNSLSREVYFLTGADEHGIKIVRSAQEKGISVKEFVDENAGKIKLLVEKLNISNNDFIRTSDKERHWRGAQALWKKLADTGDIYKSKYKGYYCVGCEAYVTEKDLVNGKCQYHDKEPELIEEDNYFFKLSKYANIIKKKIESDELEILPKSRKNEILAMIDRGIDDTSFSRPANKLDGWGVPVPGDETHLMYVWCDALSNYITALGYGLDDHKNVDKFWPADLHIIGKDILRFHAVIWPAMLLSAGLKLPKQIFVHGFVLSEGRRMSKTLGNTIDPFELIEEYGADAVRYYFLREITPFGDGDITEEKFKEAYNANLANGLGNLTARIMKMSEQYLEGEKLAIESGKLPEEYRKFMNGYELSKTMDLIWEKITDLDSRIQKTEPFKLIKTNPGQAKIIVKELVIGLGDIAVMLLPFMPATSGKILEAIKTNKMPEPLFLRV